MKTFFEYGGENFFSKAKTASLISADQHESKDGRFRVTYGLQVIDQLSYEQACLQIGACILHHLCCEGIASNASQ